MSDVWIYTVDKTEITSFIKNEAARIGFDGCGIAPIRALSEELAHVEQWLNEGMHADMAYMARNLDKRIDPQLLVSNTKSIVCLLLSYKPQQEQSADLPKIARYAYGNDYHDIIRHKLKELLISIQQVVPHCEGRGFVDSAPVLERAWAVQAGLGWIGKNGLLLTEQFGSYTFLAELILTIELDYDSPFEKLLCGSCTRCIEACPNTAIVQPKVVDARKCISYQSIENKGELTTPLHGWLFGCDCCQEVCPWNKKAKPVNHFELSPITELLAMDMQEWETLSEKDFTNTFNQSALLRTGFLGIQRNLKHLKQENSAT